MPINVWDYKKGLYVPVGSIDDKGKWPCCKDCVSNMVFGF